MDEKFSEMVTDLLKESNMHFPKTDVREIEIRDNESTVNISCSDCISFARTEKNFEEVPVIPCLVMFALFDSYVEEKFNLTGGGNFKSRYENIPADSRTPLNVITKECYRLIRLIRNCFVHNMSGINHENDMLHFRNRNNNLDINQDTLALFYYLIILIVNKKYEVKTRGHFESAVIRYYGQLRAFITEHGNFRDDLGSAPFPAVNAPVALKTGVRYCVENATWLIRFAGVNSSFDKLQITEKYRAVSGIVGKIDYSEYGTDYLIVCEGNSYIIPLEALDEEDSILLTDLEIWKKG